jgi:hypothetical protein
MISPSRLSQSFSHYSCSDIRLPFSFESVIQFDTGLSSQRDDPPIGFVGRLIRRHHAGSDSLACKSDYKSPEDPLHAGCVIGVKTFDLS